MKKIYLLMCILGIVFPYYHLINFLSQNEWSMNGFWGEIFSSHPISMISMDLTVAATTFLIFIIHRYKTKKINLDILKTENIFGKSPTFKTDSSTWTWDNANKKLKLNTTIENPDKSDSYYIFICDMKDNYTADELGLTFASIRPIQQIRGYTPLNKLKYRVQSVLKIEKQTVQEIEIINDLNLSSGDHGFLAIIAPTTEKHRQETKGTGKVGDQIIVDDGIKYHNFRNYDKIITTNVKISPPEVNTDSSAKYRYDIYAGDNFAGVFSQDPDKNKFYIRYMAFLDENDHDLENLEYGYVREEVNDENKPEVESPVKIPVFNETTKKMELSDKEYSLPDKKDVPRYTKDDSYQALMVREGPVGNRKWSLNRNKNNIPSNTKFYTDGKYPYIKGNSKVYKYDGYHYFTWDDVLKTEPMFSIYSDAKIGKGIIFVIKDARSHMNLIVKETLQSDNTCLLYTSPSPRDS